MHPRKIFQKTIARAYDTSAKVAGTFSHFVDPYHGSVEVTSVHLPIPHLGKAFDHYRIVQISDLHYDGSVRDKHLFQIVELVNQQEPDLIAITGDFVTSDAESYADGLIDILSRLDPGDDTVAVMGNHDHLTWSEPKVIRAIMAESGIVNLNNRIYTLEYERDTLHIAGVDDVCTNHHRLDVVMQAMPANGAAIMLCHVPDFADTVATTNRFDLQLSGHTHGGQIHLPIVGAPALPKYGRKYTAGLYKVRAMHLYTNRGIGHPQMRFNCRPEITVFDLLAGGQRF